MSRLDRIEAAHASVDVFPGTTQERASDGGAVLAEHDAIPGLLAIAREADALAGCAIGHDNLLPVQRDAQRRVADRLRAALADFEAGQ